MLDICDDLVWRQHQPTDTTLRKAQLVMTAPSILSILFELVAPLQNLFQSMTRKRYPASSCCFTCRLATVSFSQAGHVSAVRLKSVSSRGEYSNQPIRHSPSATSRQTSSASQVTNWIPPTTDQKQKSRETECSSTISRLVNWDWCT